MNCKEFYRKLGRAIYWIDGAYDSLSKNENISVTSSMLWFLYAMDDDQKHTQKQICQDWHMKKTTVNTLVKECERKGYIELKAIPGMKREMYIELTSEGKEFASKVLAIVYEAENKVFEEFIKCHDMSFVNEFEEFAEVIEKEFIKDRECDDE